MSAGWEKVRRLMPAAALEALVARHGGYLRLGPIYVTNWRTVRSDQRNAFELGRDYERGQQEKSTAAR